MDERRKPRFIPPNFENGINILGLNFRVIFLIEGAFIGIVFFTLLFTFIRKYIPIASFGQSVGVSLALAGAVSIIGIRGINDEPISKFLANVFKFLKNKRTCYYNPRVKKEAVSYADERQQLGLTEEPIPRERIIALIDDIKLKMPAKTITNDGDYDPSTMQFADDKLLEDIKKQEEEKERKGKKK